MDDWPQVVSALRRELGRSYQVLEATSAAEARAAAGHPLDAAVIDILMPDVSGLALAEELRGRGFLGPLVFITTSGDPSLVEKVAQLAPARLIWKPWGPGEVVDAVRELTPAP